MVLGLSKVLEEELAQIAHRAVGMDVALDSHTALGEVLELDVELGVELDMELDVALDLNKVLKIAALGDMGRVLELCTVLGEAMDVEQEVGIVA